MFDTRYVDRTVIQIDAQPRMVRMTRRNLAANFISMTSACGGGEAKTNTRPQGRESTMSRDRIEPQVHRDYGTKVARALGSTSARCICNYIVCLRSASHPQLKALFCFSFVHTHHLRFGKFKSRLTFEGFEPWSGNTRDYKGRNRP